MQTQQTQQGKGSRLAAELNARLAGSAPLPDVVAWWREEWRKTARTEEEIFTSEMNENEGAVFGIGLIEELRALNESHGVPGAASIRG
jgi:hypothetical protein